MNFTHQPYLPGETISAIATPPGVGGIAIVRISGKGALAVGEKLFSGKVETYLTHTAHYGRVLDGEGKKIDEALLLVFLGKRSFTGEDTVEIHCHGGTIAAKKVLEASFLAGCRPAKPGEFTFKAFMNGKLDLTQAEAVQELIGAKNERAFSLASGLLEGRLSHTIGAFQRELTAVAAILEAWVDFPEEGLAFATEEEIATTLEGLSARMQALVETYHDGHRVSEGLSLAIVGAPNAGKSSLMNALLGRERAIVTPIAGTTRDVLEEDVHLNGLHFRLLDTAGIRETEDPIEREGIERALKALFQADLILFVLDASCEVQREVVSLASALPETKTIAVWNKSDLPRFNQTQVRTFPHQVDLSVKEGRGLERLKQEIDGVIWRSKKPGKEDLLLSHLRHKEALEKAGKGCLKVISDLREGISPEFLVFDLRESLFHLGTILGADVTEEILDSIFSQFCIGK